MKPLLAEKVDLDKLQFPYMTSVKFDGFRCLVDPIRGAVTRSLKPVSNAYVRGKLEEFGLDHLDGELLTYTAGKLDDFNTTQSKLSTRSGMPEFKFMVFDCYKHPSWAFKARLLQATTMIEKLDTERVCAVHHQTVTNLDSLMYEEGQAVQQGWEGLMLRDPEGKYKFGRSTLNEGILLKMKRLDDDEGEVVDYYERMHNANEAKTNTLGYTERSSHKENMVPTGTLGGVMVKWREVVFGVGTGFDDAQRTKFWEERDSLKGRTVTFAYQGVGSGGRPRFPRFRGFRAAEDLS